MNCVQKILLTVILAAGGLASTSCGHEGHPADSRRVMLYYVAGYNDISSYLRDDIADLKSGSFIPSSKSSSNILLVFSRLADGSGTYGDDTSPVLFRLYRKSGRTVADTLRTWPANTIASDASTLTDVLTDIRNRFPAKSYGLVFSSHATGWVPEGYYTSAGRSVNSLSARGAKLFHAPAVPDDPDLPPVKSVGRDLRGRSYPYELTEIEVQQFADAIPYKLDYLLFDCCLMGGVETAYALAGKTKHLLFSQTEVLAEGFRYETIASHLIGKAVADPLSVGKEYFGHYDALDGSYRSATISLIDCDAIAPLSDVCKTLFEKYRTSIQGLSKNDVQRFGRYHGSADHNWYFDLRDILVKAGITDDELVSLQNALDQCVLYEAHTPSFLNAFKIETSCGLSMYLPSSGNSTLDAFYTSFSWNEATGLIK